MKTILHFCSPQRPNVPWALGNEHPDAYRERMVMDGSEFIHEYDEPIMPTGFTEPENFTHAFRVENLRTGVVKVTPSWGLEAATWYACALSQGLLTLRAEALEALEKLGLQEKEGEPSPCATM